jgi:hypothetical protein
MSTIEEKIERYKEAKRRGEWEARASEPPLARRVAEARDEIAEGVERRVHEAKRAARHGKFAIEDGIDDLKLRVRRRPAASLAIAFVAGGVAALTTRLLLRLRRRRRIEQS